MQTYSLFTSNVAMDIWGKTRILGTVAALGGMSNGGPNPNLVPLIVLDLGKSLQAQSCLAYQATEMSIKPDWCNDSFP